MRKAAIVLMAVAALTASGADYNRWVIRPCTYGESLWKNRRVAYRHCVSLRPKDLVAVLRWLRPGTRIAMGPAGHLNNL